MEEISRKERRCKIEWVEERRKFFEERGYAPGEVERRVAGGFEMRTELELRDKEIQEQEIEGRIRGGRFNGWFKEVRVGGLPRYLKKKGKEEKKRNMYIKEKKRLQQIINSDVTNVSKICIIILVIVISII